jgi:hypothetical protein
MKRFNDTKFCFINMHLTAHQNKYNIRNNDYHNIMSTLHIKKGIKYLPNNHE